MSLRFFRMSGLFVTGLILVSFTAAAQKKPLDLKAIDGWKHISDIRITPDGKTVAYEIRQQSGENQLVFISDKGELRINRGCDALLSSDGKYAWFRIKAVAVSGEKVKDTLGFVSLKSLRVDKYPSLTSFSAGKNKQPYCAYLSGYMKGDTHCRSLIVLDPDRGEADTLRKVTSFSFSSDGLRLAAVVSSGKAFSAFLYDIAAKRKTDLASDLAYCSKPSFSQDGKRLVFLASSDTNSTGLRHCSLRYFNGFACKEVIGQNRSLSSGYALNQYSSATISPDNSRIFFYVAPFPESTPVSDNNPARVDIWSYDDQMTPPQAKLMKDGLRKTYKAVVNIDGSGLLRLTSNMNDDIRLLGEGGGEYALSIDKGPYAISDSWTFLNEQDLYLVSLKDGFRKEIAKQLRGFVSTSPKGHYIVWANLDEGKFYSYRISDGKRICLTDSQGVNFFDEENDRPHKPFPYCSVPSWTEDDESVLLCDRYDIWQIGLGDGKAVNLTSGFGRENKIIFRYADLSGTELTDSEKMLDTHLNIVKSDGFIVTAFDETLKRNGLAHLKIGASVKPLAVLDTMSFTDAVKASKADAIVYQKGNFEVPADLYITKDYWRTQTRLSDINPQRNDYSWGTARRVEWKAYDGTQMTGILYVPESVGDSCPMIVYFYERRSETLYDWIEPGLVKSRINISYMCSNGYAVFVPDVVFKTGHPGESAYNCIVSGTEAICQQFPFIDRNHIGMQGHSWGGYMATYLVTCTDVFKAAVAGAPVSNMTSAYGGIRWESGTFRAWQYENDQSRIGKSLWDEGGLALYIENSPVFFADKVHTPLLMMSNDADGAVPWYQGIEMFSALRRFGSPVWMLQYNDEGHKLSRREDSLDYTIRIKQFFDYYLKGLDKPAWMTKHNY